MGRDNLINADNLVDGVAVAALVVEGFDRLGDFAFGEVLDGGVILRLELVDLKIGAAGLRVGHLAAVGLGRGILRVETRCERERKSADIDLVPEGIQLMEGCLTVGVGVLRTDEDVAGVEHIALFLKHFDDMESVRGLYDLGDDAGLQGHGSVGERRPEDRLRSHAELAALAGAAGVLGIDAGEGREFLAGDNPLAEAEELFLDRKLRGFAVGVDAHLAELVLDRNHREVFDVDAVEVLLHIVGSELRDGGCHLRLLLLGKALVLKGFLPFSAKPVERLPEVFLHCRVAAEGSPDLVYPLVELA